MRPLIEFYFVVALLLGQWLQFIKPKRLLFCATILILLMLAIFSLFQTWQFKNGILPAKHLSSATYWDNFLNTTLKARVYVDKNEHRLVKSFFTDMESDPGWLNYASWSDELAFSGRLSSKIDSSNIYSIGLREDISAYLGNGNSQVIVSAMVYSENESSSAQLIIDFLDQNKTSIGYNTFFLREFLPVNKWTYVEFSAKVPVISAKEANLAIYFWNPASNERLFVDDILIEVREQLPIEN
jgi:hypothetical protein